jgi:hypothetical protein
MRRIILGILDVAIWAAIVAGTLGGIVLGGKVLPQRLREATEFDWSLGFVGGLCGFLLGLLIFGAIAALLQIEENTRRSNEIFSALVRRAENRMTEDSE